MLAQKILIVALQLLVASQVHGKPSSKLFRDIDEPKESHTAVSSAPTGTNDSYSLTSLRVIFEKWGYKPEEIPEPIGTKKPSEEEGMQVSPEFETILKGLRMSVTNDLTLVAAVDNILRKAKVIDSSPKLKHPGSRRNLTKLQQIDETISEILNDTIKKKDTPQTQAHPPGRTIPEREEETPNPTMKDVAKSAKKRIFTHCEEKNGTSRCDTGGIQKEEEIVSSSTSAATAPETDKAGEHEHGIFEVDLSSSCTVESIRANEGTIQSLLLGLLTGEQRKSENAETHRRKFAGISKAVKDFGEMAEKCMVSLTQAPHTTKTVSTTTTTRSPESGEIPAQDQDILDKMRQNPNTRDVTILGNSAKETGYQMGKLSVELMEASKARTTTSTTKSTTTSTSHKPTTTGTSSTSKTTTTSTSSTATGHGKTNTTQHVLIGGLEFDTVEAFKEKNKQQQEKIQDIIQHLKITGKTEEDRERVEKIEELVEAIKEEGERTIELEEDLVHGHGVHGKKSHSHPQHQAHHEHTKEGDQGHGEGHHPHGHWVKHKRPQIHDLLESNAGPSVSQGQNPQHVEGKHEQNIADTQHHEQFHQETVASENPHKHPPVPQQPLVPSNPKDSALKLQEVLEESPELIIGLLHKLQEKEQTSLSDKKTQEQIPLPNKEEILEIDTVEKFKENHEQQQEEMLDIIKHFKSTGKAEENRHQEHQERDADGHVHHGHWVKHKRPHNHDLLESQGGPSENKPQQVEGEQITAQQFQEGTVPSGNPYNHPPVAEHLFQPIANHNHHHPMESHGEPLRKNPQHVEGEKKQNSGDAHHHLGKEQQKIVRSENPDKHPPVPEPLIQNGHNSALSSPAEVNFNGGFNESIDVLKIKYPQGTWPSSSSENENRKPSPTAEKLQKVLEESPELFFGLPQTPREQEQVPMSNEAILKTLQERPELLLGVPQEPRPNDEYDTGTARPGPLPIHFVYDEHNGLVLTDSDGKVVNPYAAASSVHQEPLHHMKSRSTEDDNANTNSVISPENLEEIIRRERISGNSQNYAHHRQEHHQPRAHNYPAQ